MPINVTQVSLTLAEGLLSTPGERLLAHPGLRAYQFISRAAQEVHLMSHSKNSTQPSSILQRLRDRTCGYRQQGSIDRRTG